MSADESKVADSECEHLWDIDSGTNYAISDNANMHLKAECRKCGMVVEHNGIDWTEVNRLVREVYTPRVRWWRY